MQPLLDCGTTRSDAAALATIVDNLIESVEGRVRDQELRRQQEEAPTGRARSRSTREASTNSSGRGKSSHVRSGRTATFKLRVLEKFDELEALEAEQGLEGMSARQLSADIFGVDPTLISKWKKPAVRVLLEKQHKQRRRKAATTSGQRSSKKGCFPAAEKAVHEGILTRRAKALVVNGLWIRTAMRIEVQKLLGEVPSPKLQAAVGRFRASQGWLRFYCRRWRLSLLKRTNIKGKSVLDMVPALQRWHARWRARLNRPTPARKDEFDSKWGRWKLEHRYGLDQVPNPLCNFKLETYDAKGVKSVRIAVGKDGSDSKRFCTFQILHRFKGNRKPGSLPSRDPTQQPQLCICFRGKGLRISKEERAAWDPRVVVQFQPKAWYDQSTTLEWVERALSKVISLTHESCLVVDGLTSQTTKAVRRALLKRNVKLHILLANASHIIQVVDAGVGKMLKDKEGQLLLAWLEEGDNLDRWVSGSISASEKRILITRLGADAWEYVCENFSVGACCYSDWLRHGRGWQHR